MTSARSTSPAPSISAALISSSPPVKRSSRPNDRDDHQQRWSDAVIGTFRGLPEGGEIVWIESLQVSNFTWEEPEAR
jgi:hypothetical protein